jgi:CRP/FNR family cyclic AMP-dependent transcriptional regulator
VDNDIRNRLGKSLIFKYVHESRREEIISVSDVLKYGDEEQIIKEGEISSHVYLIINGEVCVKAKDNDGKQVYLSTIGEGEIFGEAGIFLKTARTADVVSLGDSRILRLHRKDLLKFIKKDPATGIKVLMIIIYGLLKKLRESNQELAYERTTDGDQEDIDALIESLMKD